MPPRTWRIAPTQLKASHAASSIPQGGRGDRGSSTSSRITASVAAAPPASAVSSIPPDSTASTAAASPSTATVPSCEDRCCIVSSTADGTMIASANRRLTPSSLRSNGLKPSCPAFNSCVDRTGTQSAMRTRIAAHAPTARTTRSIFQPATPQSATAPAVARSMATGAMSAMEGMRQLRV